VHAASKGQLAKFCRMLEEKYQEMNRLVQVLASIYLTIELFAVQLGE
jgi:hypothetical protein